VRAQFSVFHGEDFEGQTVNDDVVNCCSWWRRTRRRRTRRTRGCVKATKKTRVHKAYGFGHRPHQKRRKTSNRWRNWVHLCRKHPWGRCEHKFTKGTRKSVQVSRMSALRENNNCSKTPF
jgi:hypothetical protein